MKKTALVLLGMFVLVAQANPALAARSGFHPRDGEVFDDWDFCRTRCWGDDGFFQFVDTRFRPAIAFESLGELKETAWTVGERLAGRYSGNELAEQIFRYCRDHVTYTSDRIQFGYDEYARNADEVAWEIESRGFSSGDCEDYAVLLATMFYAAGFRSAVVLAPEHAAALVHLPGYPANTTWKFKGVEGWVWAEATARKNPLGWTPPRCVRSDLLAYELGDENVRGVGTAERPSPSGGGALFGISPFSLLFLFWLFPMFGRRR